MGRLFGLHWRSNGMANSEPVEDRQARGTGERLTAPTTEPGLRGAWRQHFPAEVGAQPP